MYGRMVGGMEGGREKLSGRSDSPVRVAGAVLDSVPGETSSGDVQWREPDEQAPDLNSSRLLAHAGVDQQTLQARGMWMMRSGNEYGYHRRQQPVTLMD